MFGDLTFLDHGEVQIHGGVKLPVLLILDAATNLVIGYGSVLCVKKTPLIVSKNI